MLCFQLVKVYLHRILMSVPFHVSFRPERALERTKNNCSTIVSVLAQGFWGYVPIVPTHTRVYYIQYIYITIFCTLGHACIFGLIGDLNVFSTFFQAFHSPFGPHVETPSCLQKTVVCTAPLSPDLQYTCHKVIKSGKTTSGTACVALVTRSY